MLSDFFDTSLRPLKWFKRSETIVMREDRATFLYVGQNGKIFYTKKYSSGSCNQDFRDRREYFLREIYLSGLYRAVLGGNKAPNISLVYDQVKFLAIGGEAEPALKRLGGDDTYDTFDGFLIASEELKGFHELVKLHSSEYSKLRGAASLILTMTFLGEKDWNANNIMFDDKLNLGKIDHGWSGAVRFNNLSAFLSFMLRQALKYNFMYMNLDMEEFSKALDRIIELFTPENLEEYKQNFLNHLKRLDIDPNNKLRVQLRDFFYMPSVDSDKKHSTHRNTFQTIEDFITDLNKQYLKNINELVLLRQRLSEIMKEIDDNQFKVVENNWLILLFLRVSNIAAYESVLKENLEQGALHLALLHDLSPLKHALLTQVPSKKIPNRQTCYSSQRLLCLTQTAKNLFDFIERKGVDELQETAFREMLLKASAPLDFNNLFVFTLSKLQLRNPCISQFARELLRASQELSLVERISMLKSIELCSDSRLIKTYVTVGQAVSQCGQNKKFSSFEMGYLAATYAFKQLFPNKEIPRFKIEDGEKWLKSYFFEVKTTNGINSTSAGIIK